MRLIPAPDLKAKVADDGARAALQPEPAQWCAAEASPSWKNTVLVINLPMDSAKADVPFATAALSPHDIINLLEAEGHLITLCEAGAGGISERGSLDDRSTVVQLPSWMLERLGIAIDFLYFSAFDEGDTHAASAVEDDTPKTAAETVVVTLNSAATIVAPYSDAVTDGSTSATGAPAVSGTAARVAADLNASVLMPAATRLTAGATVTTILTVAYKDTAGKNASGTHKVTAIQVAPPYATNAPNTKAPPTTVVSHPASTGTVEQVVALPPTGDTDERQLLDDEWWGESLFTASVHGKKSSED